VVAAAPDAAVVAVAVAAWASARAEPAWSCGAASRRSF